MGDICTMRLRLFSAAFFASLICTGQADPFNVMLEPVNVPGLGGIQSYAFGQHDGKWLIAGGRLDGLHRRQPFAAFDEAGHNTQLFVVDAEGAQHWTAAVSALPTSIAEQLSSTNMAFHQEGPYLYCFGGYGYSATAGDHITFAAMVAIDVPEAIAAIIGGGDIAPHFRQLEDPAFQVAGGRLRHMNGMYYLMGGQKFMGRYNPIGPDHGPGFVQEYTNAVRRFTLSDDGFNLDVSHLPAYTDPDLFHRRDYNAESQILPDGAQGITMFSGVFKTTEDFPFLDAVTLDADGYGQEANFQQYYNHYHCPALPLYGLSANEMHTVFFGGIAQYYDDNGVLVQDNNVPFVKTIARVTRNAAGELSEFLMPVVMPDYLGAGAEFIPRPDVPHYDNGVFKLDGLTADTTLMGHIYGGISSSAANIFWVNDGTQSTASPSVYRVWLVRDVANPVHTYNFRSNASLGLVVYPNPNEGNFRVKYYLKQACEVYLTIARADGAVIEKLLLQDTRAGENLFERKLQPSETAGVLLITLETPYESATQLVVIE